MPLRNHQPGCCCTGVCRDKELLYNETIGYQPPDPSFSDTTDPPSHVHDPGGVWEKQDLAIRWSYKTTETGHPLLAEVDRTGKNRTERHVRIGFWLQPGQTIRLYFMWTDSNDWRCFELEWLDTGPGWEANIRLIECVSGTETVINEAPAPLQSSSYTHFQIDIDVAETWVRCTLYGDYGLGRIWLFNFGWPVMEIDLEDLFEAYFGAELTVNESEVTDETVIDHLADTCEEMAFGCALCDYWYLGDLGASNQYQVSISGCTGDAAWANGTYLLTGQYLYSYLGVLEGGHGCQWIQELEDPLDEIYLEVVNREDGQWIEIKKLDGAYIRFETDEWDCSDPTLPFAYVRASVSGAESATITVQGITT